jgi:hypothetical protein
MVCASLARRYAARRTSPDLVTSAPAAAAN